MNTFTFIYLRILKAFFIFNHSNGIFGTNSIASCAPTAIFLFLNSIGILFILSTYYNIKSTIRMFPGFSLLNHTSLTLTLKYKNIP